MKLIMENWRKFLKEESIKVNLPLDKKWVGNWKDQEINVAATKKGDPDANITGHQNKASAQNFALLIDKLAEFLEMPAPVITSGYRDNGSQLRAILGIWARPQKKEPIVAPRASELSSKARMKLREDPESPLGGSGFPTGKSEAQKGRKGEDNIGSKYIMDMYRECEKRQACKGGAGDLAVKLVDIWENGQEGAGENAVNGKAYKESLDAIDANGGMSMHQEGSSIDYGLKSNPPKATHIKEMIDYIKDNKLAHIFPIDETAGAGPHWHVTVFKILPEGIRFLETPNDEWGEEDPDETPT